MGHLFQGRYKAILCAKEAYLLELVRYIHLNPVRAGLSMDPESYSWIGHGEYLGRDKGGIIDQGLVLSQLGGSKGPARRNYRRFIGEGLKEGHQKKYYEVKDQRFLGDENFFEEVEERKPESSLFLIDLLFETIVREVSNGLNIPLERMNSLSHDRRGALGRSVVGYLARKISGYRVREVAEYFCRAPMTLSEGMGKVEGQISADKGFGRELEVLEKRLMKMGKKKYLITVA